MGTVSYFHRPKKSKSTRYEIAQKIAIEPLNLSEVIRDYFERQPYELGEAFSMLGSNLPLNAENWAENLEKDMSGAKLRDIINPGWVICFGRYIQFYCGKQASKERLNSYKQH
jgi:hypothetical protein